MVQCSCVLCSHTSYSILLMKLTDAKSLARSKMIEYGVGDWDFQFDNARRRHGYCSPRQQVISLSRHFVRLNNERQVLDTILHEIAHAIQYVETKDCNHGKRWREIAETIGCSGLRLTIANMPKRKFTGMCPSCERVIQAHKRSKISCSQCSNKYDPRFLFQWN